MSSFCYFSQNVENYWAKITKKGISDPFSKNYRKHNLSNPIRELL